MQHRSKRSSIIIGFLVSSSCMAEDDGQRESFRVAEGVEVIEASAPTDEHSSDAMNQAFGAGRLEATEQRGDLDGGACGQEPVDGPAHKQIIYPVDVVTLENGTRLAFFADEESGTLVREARPEANTPSLLQLLGEDVSPVEIWQLAAAEGQPMPDELIRAAERAGIDIGDAEGMGAADSLLSEIGPLAADPSWCNSSDDANGGTDDFYDQFCDVPVSGFTGAVCEIGVFLSLGQSDNVTMPSGRTRSVGGWCQTGSSAFTLQSAPCNTSTWSEYDDGIAYPSNASYHSYVYQETIARKFRILRYAWGTAGYASYGIKYNSLTSCSS